MLTLAIVCHGTAKAGFLLKTRLTVLVCVFLTVCCIPLMVFPGYLATKYLINHRMYLMKLKLLDGHIQLINFENQSTNTNVIQFSLRDLVKSWPGGWKSFKYCIYIFFLPIKCALTVEVNPIWCWLSVS